MVAGASNVTTSQGSIERSLDFSGENLSSAGEGERLGGVSDRLEDLSRRALRAHNAGQVRLHQVMVQLLPQMQKTW